MIIVTQNDKEVNTEDLVIPENLQKMIFEIIDRK